MVQRVRLLSYTDATRFMSETQKEYETEQETDAQPTPGPWEVEDGHWDMEVTKGEYVIATAHAAVPGSALKENAHLIAAAPKMKERLMRLNTMLSWYLRPDVERAPTEDEIKEMLRWTEDALASAEGSNDE